MKRLIHYSLCVLLCASLGGLCHAAEPLSVEAENVMKKRFEQASVAELKGDNPAAYALYIQNTNEYPDSAAAWAALGEHLRFYAHDEKSAASAFQKALKAGQVDANASAFALRGLGELAIKAGQEDVAVDYFKKSIQALPLADTYRSLCHLYVRQRNFKAAAEAAEAAVKLSDGDPIALLLHAALLHRAGNAKEGRQQYDKALLAGGMNAQGQASGPIHCCVLYNAAGYLGVVADNQAALDMLKRFFETPNHRHLTRAEIESDSDFETLKTLPQFQKLLDTYLPKTAPSK